MRYEPDEVQAATVPPVPERGQNEFYIAAWRKAFDFRGVASRMEYWSFVLVNIATVVFLTAGAVLAGDGTAQYFGYAILVFIALTAIPFLSVSIRRFRDVTGTGWFVFLLPLLYPPTTGSVIGTLLGTSRSGRGNVDTSAGYGGVWRKTPDWLSRSDRTEYWMFVLFTTLIFVGSFISLSVWDTVTGFPASLFRSWGYSGEFADWAIGVMFFVLVVLSTPMLPLLVRRVRDATGSGWVTLFLFPTSLLNPILFFVTTVWPSRDEERLGRLSGGYSDVWRKTGDYVGVARRGEFWPITLIHLSILVAELVFAVAWYNALSDDYGNLRSDQEGPFFFVLFLIYASYVALSIPWFSMAVRRVRDATGSGWWLLTCLIPVIGGLVLLVLFLLPTRNATTSSPSGPSEEPMRSTDPGTQYDADDPWNVQRTGTNGR